MEKEKAKEVLKMDNNSFLFISPFVEFQEVDEGISVKVIFMELDKASVNGRIYRFAEAARIAKSLLKKPIFFGTKIACSGPFCKRVHNLSGDSVGYVEFAEVKKKLKRIVGRIRVTCPQLIQKIKEKTKYWVSVGGMADRAEFTGMWTPKGNPIVKLIGSIVGHVSILPSRLMAGFKTAKTETFQETVMLGEDNLGKLDEETLINEETVQSIVRSIEAVSILLGIDFVSDVIGEEKS